MNEYYVSADNSSSIRHYGRKGQKWYQHIFADRRSADYRNTKLKRYQEKQHKKIDREFDTRRDTKILAKEMKKASKALKKAKKRPIAFDEQMKRTIDASDIRQWKDRMRKIQHDKINQLTYEDMCVEKDINRRYRVRKNIETVFGRVGVDALAKRGISSSRTLTPEVYRMQYDYDYEMSKLRGSNVNSKSYKNYENFASRYDTMRGRV